MIFETFTKVGKPTNLYWYDEALSSMPCGVFRASSDDLVKHLPNMESLLWSFRQNTNQDANDFEFDVKIHMLMPNQYPCIPNWHCDNVPRNTNGFTDYSKASNEPLMYLWLSNGPCTQFLSRRISTNSIINGHDDVSNLITYLRYKEDNYENKPLLTTIPPQQWISMSQLTPHRGMLSDKNQWRVFVRATHKSITPDRPVVSTLRRHCQVYLDSKNFTW